MKIASNNDVILWVFSLPDNKLLPTAKMIEKRCKIQIKHYISIFEIAEKVLIYNACIM